jgi:hypothetical protein
LLDGRNRLRVCIELGIEPKIQHFDHSVGAAQLVYDLNANRRNLSDEELVVIIAQLTVMIYAERGQTAQKEAGKQFHRGSPKSEPEKVAANSTQPFRAPTTTQKIAKDAGVSDHKARQAVAVVKHAPQLAEEVKRGRMPLKEAAKQAHKKCRRMPKAADFLRIEHHAKKYFARTVARCPVEFRERLTRTLIQHLESL